LNGKRQILGKYGYTSNMSGDEKLMIAIVRVSEAYKKESTAIFKRYGITNAQYTILRVLEGSKDGQNTMGNVSKVMLVTGSNITPVAKRLEKNSFLVKKNAPRDDRFTILEITAKGRQIIKDIEEEKNNLIRKYLHGYSGAVKHEVLTYLKKSLHRYHP
jgi:MarR family 2-MHQ and catechol resistance regulon transcriptional repressor